MVIDMNKFFKRLWFKNTLLIGCPGVISVIGVIYNFLPKMLKTPSIVLVVIMGIVFVIAVLFYSNEEEQKNKELEKLKEEKENLQKVVEHLEILVKTNVFALNSIAEFSEGWAKNINTFANSVSEKGSASEKCWDKTKLFNEVCVQCKNTIQHYCNNNDNTKVSVGYIKCFKNSDGTECVNFIAHSSPESTRPTAYGVEMNLQDCKYYYAELIKDNFSDIEVAKNNEEILRRFKKISLHTDLTKYTQYIAIPIYCTNRKLLGVFQIITKHGYIIEEDSIELRKFAEEYMIPFSNMILLIDKIEKGLYSKPSV